jgi:stress-induced morphogen
VPQINEALKEELEVIHALGIKKCYTPEEWRG